MRRMHDQQPQSASGGGPKTTTLATIAVIVSLLTGIGGGVATAYSFRDKVLADMQVSLASTAASIRLEHQESLNHYVTREEWLEWRRRESEKRDRQYLNLMLAIQHQGKTR